MHCDDALLFWLLFFKTFEWDETDLCFSHRSHTVNTYLTGVERSSVQFSSKVYKCADISWYQGVERGSFEFSKTTTGWETSINFQNHITFTKLDHWTLVKLPYGQLLMVVVIWPIIAQLIKCHAQFFTVHVHDWTQSVKFLP